MYSDIVLRFFAAIVTAAVVGVTSLPAAAQPPADAVQHQHSTIGGAGHEQ